MITSIPNSNIAIHKMIFSPIVSSVNSNENIYFYLFFNVSGISFID